MDADHILVLGAVIAALGLPAAVSAWSDGRRPWAALVALLVGGGIMAAAWVAHPGGYLLAELPHVFLGVVADIIH
ncbi:hypothetical protein V8J36_17400 [Frigidibacter sp. MR17.14]|uniref:hypothetical protein n=1 Tax=Frigidibacter sp. MR17.14 TaxID=3126509 RepID=UPI003012DD2A